MFVFLIEVHLIQLGKLGLIKQKVLGKLLKCTSVGYQILSLFYGQFGEVTSCAHGAIPSSVLSNSGGAEVELGSAESKTDILISPQLLDFPFFLFLFPFPTLFQSCFIPFCPMKNIGSQFSSLIGLTFQDDPFCCKMLQQCYWFPPTR